MLLLLFILEIVAIPESFYIISTLHDITTLSRFLPQTLTKSLISTLMIQGHPMTCTDNQYGTLLTTLVINRTVTDNLYNISHHGVITGFKTYHILTDPIIDRQGHIYGVMIIDMKYQIVEIGYPDKIRYTVDKRDWLDLMIYDQGLFYLAMNVVNRNQHIMILDHWKAVKNYSIPLQYRIWTMIPHNKTLFILANNAKACYNQLLSIDLVTGHRTTIATYNNSAGYYERIDGVITAVMRNNSIYAIMNNIPTQKQYLVITDLITAKYTIQSLPFDDRITCMYSEARI